MRHQSSNFLPNDVFFVSWIGKVSSQTHSSTEWEADGVRNKNHTACKIFDFCVLSKAFQNEFFFVYCAWLRLAIYCTTVHYIWMNPLLMNVFPFISTLENSWSPVGEIIALFGIGTSSVYVFLCRIQLQTASDKWICVIYIRFHSIRYTIPFCPKRYNASLVLELDCLYSVFIIIVSCNVLCLRVSFNFIFFFHSSISFFGWQRHAKL